jgi:hypothetical protein
MIVYTPLDIKLKLPAYNKVLKYVSENYVEGLDNHTGYTSRLCPIATPFPVSNWRSAPDVFPKFELDEFKELNFAPNILEIFPEIENIFKTLPYDTLYGAMFNWHMELLPPHRDTLIDQDPPELERINVLISPHYNQKSFFLQQTMTSEPVYPTILEEYPFYAFNDTNMYHGADPVLDNRIIIVFIGILNKDKHKELIDRSVEKFKDYVIRY